MSAVVQRGYGRGSKKLGFPTSNLPQFDHMIRTLGLERGVYFGWSCIPKDSTNGEVYGIVANIGKSPTFTGQENPVNIVEAYMIDRELKSNFYDERIGMVLVGYLRPEQKFSSLNTLISQINADVEVGRSLTHLTPVSVPPYVDMEHLQRVKEVAVRIARDCAVAGSSDDCVKILQKESSAWQVKRIAGSSGSKSDWSCIAWKPT